MPTSPHTRFIDFTDTPANIHYDQNGSAQVPLDPAKFNVVNLRKFRRINILISASKASSCQLIIGKLSGATMAGSFDVPLDGRIGTFEVVGPDMMLMLNGPPKKKDTAELWVYLRS